MPKAIKYIFFILILLISCEEKIDWDFDNIQSDFIIVEGIITNENIHHKIQISKSVNNLNQQPEVVSNAEVLVFDGDNIYIFSEDQNNSGDYISDSTFIGVINRQYSLNIKCHNGEYFAKTSMVPVALFEPLLYALDTARNLYYISHIAPNFAPDESAMFEVNIDWSHLPEYQDTAFDRTHLKLYYYTLNSLDINQIFKPEQAVAYFPYGSIIEERKYSLNTEHAEFIRSLLFETEWTGGYFDTEQGNVYTNLSEGALGFFGACTVISKTIIVE